MGPTMRLEKEQLEESDVASNNDRSRPFSAADLVLGLTGAKETMPKKQKTVQEIVDEQDADADVVRAGRCCTVVFLPLLVVALLVGVLLSVGVTSGRAREVKGVPRAVLFIVEGFKGQTFNKLLEGQRLPHIRRMLVEQHGVYAVCATLGDARCARAAPAVDAVTGKPFVSAGAGLASILTGVFPRRHGVATDSQASYAVFASTSLQFPSVALRVTRAGRRATAVGGHRLLNGLNASTGQCSVPGLLDAECASPPGSAAPAEAAAGSTGQPAVAASANAGDTPPEMSCLHQRSCNLFRRVLTLASGRGGSEERQFTEHLTQLFGSLSGEGQQAGDSFDDSLLIFNFNALALRSGDAALPDFTYEPESLEYAAQAFLIDSLIGQVLALVQHRARFRKENWLVVGTSNHGGVGKSFGHFGDEDELVPFFVATYTTNTRGYRRLRPLTRSVTHMDAAPTILQWLGIAPYDTEKSAVAAEEGLQHDDKTAAAATSTAAARAPPRAAASEEARLDGVPQGICGTGLNPKDCVVEEQWKKK
ncbi:arylsulfatase G [Trypanosoma rangeli]|uniref:Arylsulfatase G n=1 Tax=Trypanosoma rangeli TaxID=5698 RepID=A0A422NA33_TRYRA|nr:arylsulfatase G [Trypanosoma rangeli]RNF02344.1 arylsulfatase G [Trypanosoma rangeli]|eukprot:RNF02344.1 arylsulfatase G [Trypanosoma rangeli]